MSFSDLTFLFYFLPLFFAVYYILPFRFKNAALVLGSFAFYFIGAGARDTLLLSGVLPNVSGFGSIEIAFLFVFKGFLGEVNAPSVLVLYRIASYFFPFIIGVIVFMACRKKIVPEKKEA